MLTSPMLQGILRKTQRENMGGRGISRRQVRKVTRNAPQERMPRKKDSDDKTSLDELVPQEIALENLVLGGTAERILLEIEQDVGFEEGKTGTLARWSVRIF
jgi:hypothetical protein